MGKKNNKLYKKHFFFQQISKFQRLALLPSINVVKSTSPPQNDATVGTYPNPSSSLSRYFFS